MRPMAGSTVERYRIALGPDGTGANGFDRAGLGTNVGGGANPHGTQNSFHVWKDLGHPSVTITGGPAEMSEGSTASFTLTANPAPSTPLALTVDVTDSGDFATAGQSGSRTVSIGLDGTGSFTVTTVDDSTVEPNGAITAAVQVGSGYTVGWPSSAAVTVLSHDNPPVPGGDNQGIRLHALPYPPFRTEVEVTEGISLMPKLVSTPDRDAMSMVFTSVQRGDFIEKLFRSHPFGRRDSTWRGYRVIEEVDDKGVLHTRSTTLIPTATKIERIRLGGFDVLNTVDDDIDEPDGMVRTVARIPDFGNNGFTTNSVTYFMRDNDPTVVSLVRVSLGTETVATGEAIAFTVSLGRALVAGEVIDVPLLIAGKVSTDDYTLSVTGGTGATLSGTATLMPTLRFSGAGAQTATLELVPAASSVGKQYHIALGPDGDSANGFDRSGLGTNVGGGADPHATQTSFDVEVTPAQQASEPMPPELSLSSGTGGTEGAAVEFTLSAAPAPSAPLEVTLTVSQSGDHVGSGEIGQRTVTVTASGSVTVSIPTVDDEVDEADGTVTASLAAGSSGYTVGGLSSLTVEVVDNDEAVLPLSVVSSCVSEELMGTAERLYERHRHRPPEYAENWFSVLVAFGVRSPSEWTADSRTISPMTSASARQRGWGRFATALQCLEDASREVEPVVSIAGGDGVPEGSAARFTLSASPSPTAPLQVSVTVTASGAFGISTGSQTVTVPVSGSATFTVVTEDDDADEPDGGVTATVAAGAGYTLGAASAVTVAVSDDDPSPGESVVSITGGDGVPEGDGASF
ncbi:MAG: hypothetical protein F4Z73_08640, partial [Synechococcus sp. SB0668_bin_13]|nr:hypothetical protein [Synechococcus sp. SB0668_bin_13]